MGEIPSALIVRVPREVVENRISLNSVAKFNQSGKLRGNKLAASLVIEASPRGGPRGRGVPPVAQEDLNFLTAFDCYGVQVQLGFAVEDFAASAADWVYLSCLLHSSCG